MSTTLQTKTIQMSHAHYIAIGLYTNSPNFFSPKPLSNQFHQTLSPPNIPVIGVHSLVVRWWSGSYADGKLLACTCISL